MDKATIAFDLMGAGARVILIVHCELCLVGCAT